MGRNHLSVLLNIFMWNYYAYGLTDCDCAEVWWQRKMALDFAEDEEGVDGS